MLTQVQKRGFVVSEFVPLGLGNPEAKRRGHDSDSSVGPADRDPF